MRRGKKDTNIGHKAGDVARAVPAVTEKVRGNLEDLADEALRESAAALEIFGERHGDWQEHEAAMVELMKHYIPRGVTEQQYLEDLYYLATRDRALGEPVESQGQLLGANHADERAFSGAAGARAQTAQNVRG